jgi:hypothetical protein
MSERRVPLRAYDEASEAEADRTYLATQGVAASLGQREEPRGVVAVLTARRDVLVEVPFEEREHALVLLERRRRLQEIENDTEPRCPRCAHENVGTYHPFAVWVLLPLLLPFLILLFVLIPLVPLVMGLIKRKRWYCADCGHRWSDPVRKR